MGSGHETNVQYAAVVEVHVVLHVHVDKCKLFSVAYFVGQKFYAGDSKFTIACVWVPDIRNPFLK